MGVSRQMRQPRMSVKQKINCRFVSNFIIRANRALGRIGYKSWKWV